MADAVKRDILIVDMDDKVVLEVSQRQMVFSWDCQGEANVYGEVLAA